MSTDGRCHFGIAGIVSIPFTTVSFCIDIILTGVFFYLLRPTARPIALATTQAGPRTRRSQVAIPKNIRSLIRKIIIGSLLIEIPMAANMIHFVITKGREPGMICLTICVVDGTYSLLQRLMKGINTIKCFGTL